MTVITRCRPLLGTFVEITGPDLETIQAGFEAISTVQAAMSFHDPASDLGKLRRARAGETVELSVETVEVLALAARLHAATNGLFDVTVGRVLVRSGFLPRDGIGHLSRFPGNGGDIEILAETHVRLKRRALVDLGGIAKGDAVDRAVTAMRAAGAEAGLVNAGGDLRGFGDRDWTVHLREADGRVARMITLRDAALASSANLLDRRQLSGRTTTPHIGRDGAPILSPRRVSVIADRCAVADAGTKIAMADPGFADLVLKAFGGYVLRDHDLEAAA